MRPRIAPRKVLPGIALAAIAAAAVIAGTAVYYTRCVLPFESTDDAFVEGHVTAIASQVPGRVSQLFVEDNQEIKKGDLLLQMDLPAITKRVSAQAQANLMAARSQLEQAKSQFTAAHRQPRKRHARVLSPSRLGQVTPKPICRG